jgi:hypothetical protein
MSERRFPLMFLELSKFDSESKQGYDDEPDFSRELWPLIASHATAVARVVSWQGRHTSHISRRDPPELEIRNHGPMSSIGTELHRELRERSHWGGHFSVLIATDDASLLLSLIALYRRSPVLKRNLAELELPEAVLEEIDCLVRMHGCVVTLGHDGDPMLIISTQTNLRALSPESIGV